MTYDEICKKSEEYGEHSDCTVKAVAIVAGIDYETAHQKLEQEGRNPRRGFAGCVTDRICADLMGKKAKRIYPRKMRKRKLRDSDYYKMEHHEIVNAERTGNVVYSGKYSLKSIGEQFPTGRYIVHVSGHCLAMIDGEILDWSKNRLFRVNWVVKFVDEK